MILILLVFVLVLAVAFFQVIQGVYGALIMLLASLISAAVAFSYFEPVAIWLQPYLDASAEGVAMGGLFVMCLLVLRLPADQFLRANVVVGAWANRISAGAMGLMSAIIVLGVVTTAIQLLPLGPKFLTYRPFDDALQRNQSLAPFHVDQFTAGLVDLMSSGSMRPASGKTMGAVHRNLLREAFARRNTAGLHGRTSTPANALMVAGSYSPELGPSVTWANDVPLDPLEPEKRVNILIVRVSVDASAADGDHWWRLPATHFCLVGKDGRSAYPVGYLLVRDGRWQIAPAPMQEGKTLVAQLAAARFQNAQRLTVDWVFRVDSDFMGDPVKDPMSMSFRMRSWAAVPQAQPEMPPPQTALMEAMQERATPPQPRPAPPPRR
jgi:hypothetical protein